MPSLLSMGAGASEGLDTYLARLMEQAKLEALKTGQTETQRHNMATEDIFGKEHDLKDKEAAARLAETTQAHTDLRNDRAQDNGRALGDEIPAGTALNAGNDVELNHGANRDPAIDQMTRGGVGSLLKMRQASSTVPESIVAPGDTGEEQPRALIKLKSYKQQHEDQVAGKHGEDKGVVHDTENGLMRIYGDGTTEPVVDNAGKPIKGYHAPPQTDRVMIQMGDHWVPRAEAHRRFNDGEDTPLATTSSTRTMEEGARMLQPHIKRLEQTAATLDQQGLFGPVMSRVRSLMTKAGTLGDFQTAIANDPELNKDKIAGQFATSLGLLATGAGRVHGGARGGGSPQMYEHFKAMLADASSLNMFVGRLDSLDEYMSGYAAGPNADHNKNGGKPDLIFDPTTGTFKKP